MKIAIVMTFYNRQMQFERTIRSIARQSYPDLHIVVVDDCSDPPLISPPDFLIDLIRIDAKEKDWFDKEIPLNKGISRAIVAGADIIIIQNAECFHVGDVLRYATSLTDARYISFGCFSLGRARTESNNDAPDIKRGATYDGDEAWYNHPSYFPRGYDWCSAVTTENMRKLNGMDERFSYGVAYGDDDFLRRVRDLGLSVEITAYPYVVHQWHYTAQNVERITSERWQRNQLLYESLSKTKNPRALHLNTTDFDAL